MLPIELIRRNPEEVRRGAQLKGEEAPIDEILELDERWRQATTEAESTRAEQNQLSKEFARSKDQSLLPLMRELGFGLLPTSAGDERLITAAVLGETRDVER